MAAFGAEYICFAPFSEAETDAAAPKYGEMMNLGPVMTANMTITNAKGEIYGDNKAQESVSEFVSAAIATDLTDCEPKKKAAVLGAHWDDSAKEV